MGEEESETSPTLLGSGLINHALSIAGYGKTIDNLRVQRMMGINLLTGKASQESIPSEKDRSMFSCEKYQFFLDAPFEISNACCNVMKKSPAKKYAKETGRYPITAQMASESRLRSQQWLNHGCNGFDMKSPISNPMSFWFEQDVLAYVVENHLKLASQYGRIVADDGEQIDGQISLSDFGVLDLERPLLKTTGLERTGCAFCGYGCHREKRPNRFELIDVVSNPTIRDFCMRGGRFEGTTGLWKPDERGLGMWFVIQWINFAGKFSIYIPEYERYEKEYGNEFTRMFLEQAKEIGIREVEERKARRKSRKAKK